MARHRSSALGTRTVFSARGAGHTGLPLTPGIAGVQRWRVIRRDWWAESGGETEGGTDAALYWRELLSTGCSEPPTLLSTGRSEPPTLLSTGRSKPLTLLSTGRSEPLTLLSTGRREPLTLLSTGRSEPLHCSPLATASSSRIRQPGVLLRSVPRRPRSAGANDGRSHPAKGA